MIENHSVKIQAGAVLCLTLAAIVNKYFLKIDVLGLDHRIVFGGLLIVSVVWAVIIYEKIMAEAD